MKRSTRNAEKVNCLQRDYGGFLFNIEQAQARVDSQGVAKRLGSDCDHMTIARSSWHAFLMILQQPTTLKHVRPLDDRNESLFER